MKSRSKEPLPDEPLLDEPLPDEPLLDERPPEEPSLPTPPSPALSPDLEVLFPPLHAAAMATQRQSEKQATARMIRAYAPGHPAVDVRRSRQEAQKSPYGFLHVTNG